MGNNKISLGYNELLLINNIYKWFSRGIKSFIISNLFYDFSENCIIFCHLICIDLFTILSKIIIHNLLDQFVILSYIIFNYHIKITHV